MGLRVGDASEWRRATYETMRDTVQTVNGTVGGAGPTSGCLRVSVAP